MKANLKKLEFYSNTGSEIQISICRGIALLTFIGIIFLSGMANGQTSLSTKHSPIDVPIGQVAPHIPVMLKANGQGNTFSYGGYVYAKDLNIQNLRSWINQYPNEVSNYTKMIKGLLKQEHNDDNSQLFAATYIDAKAQYVLIQKLLK
jgi:hypothetical protein